MSDSGCRFSCNIDDSSKETSNSVDDFEYRSGDRVTIILNLKDATIAVGQKDDPFIAWTNIKIDKDVSYRFAASIRDQLDSISIVDFVEQD